MSIRVGSTTFQKQGQKICKYTLLYLLYRTSFSLSSFSSQFTQNFGPMGLSALMVTVLPLNMFPLLQIQRCNFHCKFAVGLLLSYLLDCMVQIVWICTVWIVFIFALLNFQHFSLDVAVFQFFFNTQYFFVVSKNKLSLVCLLMLDLNDGKAKVHW